jgi:hypothetical protein
VPLRVPALVAAALVACTALATSGAAATGGIAAGEAGVATGPRCLQGHWRTTNVEANELLQRLVPLPELKVSRGVLTAAFGGGEMRYGSTSFQVAFSTAALVMRGSASFLYEARYTATRSRIALGRGSSEVAITKLKATKDGKTITVPGVAPTTRAIPAGSVRYTCRGGKLKLRPPVGAPGGAYVTFSRVG